MATLGERIKQLRQNKNLSVRQLAKEVGVTASFIYQLEQDKVSPSFSTLKSIAGVLNTNMSLLIEEELPEEWVIIKKDKRRQVKTENSLVNLELFSFLGTRNKKMQPLMFNLEPGAMDVKVPLFSGEHEDFIYLMQGEVTIATTNAKYNLKEGDAAYIMFEELVEITNVGREKARGLWVICPPGI
ncbi:helix-turn-helix domain-containing protein [Desulfoscipio gibsoniae]|uniref:Putative transcriptional regulator n=1 Tax=Desulfoscipio gibsoniae DSM 7213 TaxID=767817 RepID=R4KH86_9FIRM|nr:helix-turn-helix transcriptional regulator [Desulfoscipio gibsoniae]AGL02553.1 putative transcriptional regulator [Desulfoscipio gibsoniae DSM 7213]